MVALLRARKRPPIKALRRPVPVARSADTNEADPSGANFFVFKSAWSKTRNFSRLTGRCRRADAERERGFADVWKKGCFAWEYKGKKKNLDEAYKQLLRYRESLLNPPLLVVCDFDRYIVKTNFNGTVQEVHEFTNAKLTARKIFASFARFSASRNF